MEPLQKEADEINKRGKKLIDSAGPGVNTDQLEADLDHINDKMGELNQQVADRDRKLDRALLSTGKFQEAFDSVLEWLAGTEDLLNNQKPPSSDYKVVKAQLQEQKVCRLLSLICYRGHISRISLTSEAFLENLEEVFPGYC